MNDTEIIEQIRISVADVHMGTPVDTIIAQGRAHRHSRRVLGVGIAGTLALAVALAGIEHARTTPTPNPANAQLTAFSVATAADGTTSLTLRKGSEYRLDPDALRQALAAHNIPATVTLNETCDTTPQPQGLDEVVTTQRNADGAVYLTINPAAMPSGAELSIGYYPSHTTFSLAGTGLPLHCSDGHGADQTTTQVLPGQPPLQERPVQTGP
jgi:hypothetical protein